MKKEALVALNASIEKWEPRAAGDHTERTGPHTCPLCVLYNNKIEIEDNCIGCPVFEKTRRSYCHGTPYYAYVICRTDANAQKELDFLKSLLPLEEENENKFGWTDLNYLGKKEKDLWT